MLPHFFLIDLNTTGLVYFFPATGLLSPKPKAGNEKEEERAEPEVKDHSAMFCECEALGQAQVSQGLQSLVFVIARTVIVGADTTVSSLLPNTPCGIIPAIVIGVDAIPCPKPLVVTPPEPDSIHDRIGV